MEFQAKIRYWNPELNRGLAVADIPGGLVAPLGGLKQMKVKGTINGAGYQSNVMPAGSGRLALSVSQKMMKAGASAWETWRGSKSKDGNELPRTLRANSA